MEVYADRYSNVITFQLVYFSDRNSVSISSDRAYGFMVISDTNIKNICKVNNDYSFMVWLNQVSE
jgi:hypothetical protein